MFVFTSYYTAFVRFWFLNVTVFKFFLDIKVIIRSGLLYELIFSLQLCCFQTLVPIISIIWSKLVFNRCLLNELIIYRHFLEVSYLISPNFWFLLEVKILTFFFTVERRHPNTIPCETLWCNCIHSDGFGSSSRTFWVRYYNVYNMMEKL